VKAPQALLWQPGHHEAKSSKAEEPKEGKQEAAGSDAVLVMAGIELVFFLVAGVVLCFGFGMSIVLITY